MTLSGGQVVAETYGPGSPGTVMDQNGTGPVLVIRNAGSDALTVTNLGGVSISTALSVSGQLSAANFFGDGSGLTNINATDNTKVAKIGDNMTGQLSVSASTPSEAPLMVNNMNTGDLLRIMRNNINAVVVTNGGTLSISNPLTGAESLRVDAPTGQTGNLLRLRMGGVDKFIVDNNGNVPTMGTLSTSGAISASSNIGNGVYAEVSGGPGAAVQGVSFTNGAPAGKFSLNAPGATVNALQVDVDGSGAAFYANHKGSGNLIKLERNNVAKLVVDNDGGLSLSNQVNTTIPIQVAAVNGQTAALVKLAVNGLDKFKVLASGGVTITQSVNTEPMLKMDRSVPGGTPVLLIQDGSIDRLLYSAPGELLLKPATSTMAYRANAQPGYTGKYLEFSKGAGNLTEILASGALSMSTDVNGDIPIKVIASAGLTANMLTLKKGASNLLNISSNGQLSISTDNGTAVPLSIATPGGSTAKFIEIRKGPGVILEVGPSGALSLSTDATGVVPLYANAPAGQSANLLELGVNGVQKLKVDNLGGLSSSGIVSASAFVADMGGIKLRSVGPGSMPLDFYDSNTWTCALEGTTVAGSPTWSFSPACRYVRVGSLVTVTGHLDWTSHTGTGNLVINGLPFASKNVTDLRATCSFHYQNLTVGASRQLAGLILPNTTQIVLEGVADAVAAAAVAMDGNGTIVFTCSYEAN